MGKQDGHNIKWIGIGPEDTFKVNKIPDFTDGSPTCNPLIANIGGSFDVTINDLNEVESKSLNGFGAIGGGDIQSGDFNHTLAITGNIIKNGMGFVLSPFFQVDSWDGTDMVFNVEDTNYTCITGSHTIYIPVGCGTLNSGSVLTGCIPVSIELNANERTWTVNFKTATYNTRPTPVMLPQKANYNMGGLTDADFSIIKNKGKLTLDGAELETKSLTITLTYEERESEGMYDSTGEMTYFVVGNHKLIVSYSSDYDTADTATNVTAAWLADYKNRDIIENLGFVFNDNVSNSITGAFTGIRKVGKKNTPGSDLFSYDVDIESVGNPAQTMEIKVKDAFGDITAEI